LLSSKYYRKVGEDENYDLSCSPIDEDARGAINVEFSTQLRNTMHFSSPNLTSFSR
jgi:hypothetical protein